MAKILIVDNDPIFRGILRERLDRDFEIAETGDFDEALEIAMQSKPDCILMEIGESQTNGVALSRKLASLSFTQSIPILAVTQDPATSYKLLFPGLNIKGYVEKPVNYTELKIGIDRTLKSKPAERRREPRIQLRVIVKLRGLDLAGTTFELGTTTEDVSANGFSCGLTDILPKDSIVDVFVLTGGERFVGSARVARTGRQIVQSENYGFQFVEKPIEWIIQ